MKYLSSYNEYKLVDILIKIDLSKVFKSKLFYQVYILGNQYKKHYRGYIRLTSGLIDYIYTNDIDLDPENKVLIIYNRS